jgi:hypothetical protein
LCDHLPESSVPRAGPQMGVAAKAGRTLTPLAASWVITVGIAQTLAAVWSSVHMATMFAGVPASLLAVVLLRGLSWRARPRSGRDKSDVPVAFRKSSRLMPKIVSFPLAPCGLHARFHDYQAGYQVAMKW